VGWLRVVETLHGRAKFINDPLFLAGMEGVIKNYVISRHRMTGNQMVVVVAGCDSKEKAAKYVGKQVSYATGKKDMVGKVTKAHGNSGALKVHFETGMPGQAIGKKVKIA
jgi:large subunit ribosomal protein L35Ae